jgi:isocitrate/isopropylmalate dehydrogenase
MILSAAMMLRLSFNLPEAALAVERAVERVLAEGARTPDLISHWHPGDHAGDKTGAGKGLDEHSSPRSRGPSCR